MFCMTNILSKYRSCNINQMLKKEEGINLYKCGRFINKKDKKLNLLEAQPNCNLSIFLKE